MGLCRTDAGDNTLAYTSQNRIFPCTTNQLMDVGTHRDTGFGNQLNTVLGHSCYGRRVDDFRIDTGLYGLKHITTCQVNRCRLLKRKVYVGLRSRDQGMHHALHVSACHIMCFEIIAGNRTQTCFMRLYQAGHNDARGHITDAHQEQLEQRDLYTRHFSREPKEEGDKMKKDRQQNNRRYGYHCDKSGSFKHNGTISGD